MAPGRSQPPEGCCRSPPGSAALSGRLGCVAAAAQRLQVRRVQATLRRDPDRHDVVNLDRNLNRASILLTDASLALESFNI